MAVDDDSMSTVPNKKTAVLHLHARKWNRLADAAASEGMTMSMYMERMIDLGLEVYEDPDAGLKGTLVEGGLE